jgi:DNA-damage-inducible protein J
MMTSTTVRISVNIDSEIKKSAQRILSEIGMDMTTAIDLLLRTIIREERIPFELRTYKSYHEELYLQFVRIELAKSKIEAADLNTKWLTQSDVMTKLDQQRAARHDL